MVPALTQKILGGIRESGYWECEITAYMLAQVPYFSNFRYHLKIFGLKILF